MLIILPARSTGTVGTRSTAPAPGVSVVMDAGQVPNCGIASRVRHCCDNSSTRWAGGLIVNWFRDSASSEYAGRQNSYGPIYNLLSISNYLNKLARSSLSAGGLTRPATDGCWWLGLVFCEFLSIKAPEKKANYKNVITSFASLDIRGCRDCYRVGWKWLWKETLKSKILLNRSRQEATPTPNLSPPDYHVTPEAAQ
ncbi:hypothetical protein J6590_017705 [Homalodisca vitripennis]|nr:hypothetical protein J6590_017705 [Homalodisca vitripennis]